MSNKVEEGPGNVTKELDELRQNLITLSDQALMRIATIDLSEYRPEAVQIARDELKRRNVSEIALEAYQADGDASTLTQFEPSAGYAGFWKRLGASVIDYAIFCVVCIVCGGILFISISPLFPSILEGDGLNLASLTVVSILSLLYWAGLESSPLQATLGKRLFGMKVTDLEGNRLAFRQAGWRLAGKVVTALTLGVGFLTVGFTKRNQALHDWLTDCLVVNR
jgi:uncharacterized RDD family membrane protein YckC